MRAALSVQCVAMFKHSLVAFAAAFIAAWPLAARAQELTPDQVRATWADQGYVVDAPSTWADGVMMLAIHDPQDELPGWPAARAFIFTAPVDHSPAQMLAGYGPPQWLEDNVAI